MIAKLTSDGNGNISEKVNVDKVETNVLVLEMKEEPVSSFVERLAKVGDGREEQEEREHCQGKTTAVRCLPWEGNSLRLVTHCDVDKDMARSAALKILHVARKLIK